MFTRHPVGLVLPALFLLAAGGGVWLSSHSSQGPAQVRSAVAVSTPGAPTPARQSVSCKVAPPFSVHLAPQGTSDPTVAWIEALETVANVAVWGGWGIGGREAGRTLLWRGTLEAGHSTQLTLDLGTPDGASEIWVEAAVEGLSGSIVRDRATHRRSAPAGKEQVTASDDAVRTVRDPESGLEVLEAAGAQGVSR